jgi:uncharacterized membrane protein
MRRLIVLAALGLCACGDKQPDSNQPAPPDIASNFNGPIDARGADPQWGLKIRGLEFTLERPNQPNLVAKAPGAVLTPHTAAWTATLPGGEVMKVNLYGSACTDAASGATYPFSAEVQLPDARPLSGCAGKPAAGTR